MPTQKYTDGAGELRARAAHRPSLRAVRAARSSPPRSPGCDGTTLSSDGSCATNRGDELRARFVTMGTGPLHRPKLPGVPGIETFEGHCFHTSRWDYDYTGGDWRGAPMDGLADRRVGIIGTGATAVQCIPRSHATRRSCSCSSAHRRRWMCATTIRSTRTSSRRSSPGGRTSGARTSPPCSAADSRTRTWSATAGPTSPSASATTWSPRSPRAPSSPPRRSRRPSSAATTRRWRRSAPRVDAIVDDPATAEALKPWYRQICKRPCFHDEYLQAFNEPGVHLVDTDGKGVERIDETGVWVDGTHHELDCLIFASGFEVGTEQSRRAGYETVGRDGLTLSEHWARRHAEPPRHPCRTVSRTCSSSASARAAG